VAVGRCSIVSCVVCEALKELLEALRFAFARQSIADVILFVLVPLTVSSCDLVILCRRPTWKLETRWVFFVCSFVSVSFRFSNVFGSRSSCDVECAIILNLSETVFCLFSLGVSLCLWKI
jgi:hypothetical protein